MQSNIKGERAQKSFNDEVISVTIFSNSVSLEKFLYSNLKVQVMLVTLFISPSILLLWELHALSLYKPLATSKHLAKLRKQRVATASSTESINKL